MTDLPDWTTQQQAGGIRYVGPISVTIGGGGSGGGSLNVTLLPLDRSIIVVCPGRGAITTTTVDVLTNDPAVSPALLSTSAGVSAAPQPVNAYVSPAITSLWQVAVDMTGPPAGPYVFYVFVDSSVTHVAVDPGAASIPVGITSPALGQGTMLQSLPVVIASDQTLSVLETNPAAVAANAVASGAANTLGVFVQVVAAPGAGLHNRVFAVGYQNVNTAQTPARVYVNWTGGSGAANFWEMSLAGFAGQTLVFPGGIRMGANIALTVQTMADIAALSGHVFAWYNVEA